MLWLRSLFSHAYYLTSWLLIFLPLARAEEGLGQGFLWLWTMIGDSFSRYLVLETKRLLPASFYRRSRDLGISLHLIVLIWEDVQTEHFLLSVLKFPFTSYTNKRFRLPEWQTRFLSKVVNAVFQNTFFTHILITNVAPFICVFISSFLERLFFIARMIRDFKLCEGRAEQDLFSYKCASCMVSPISQYLLNLIQKLYTN